MPQDAYTLGFIAKELNSTLAGGKISKIIQPVKDELIFIIYTRGGSVKLEINLSARSCRINIAEGETPAQKVAPAFCMLLRKHLQNAKILGIEQVPHERIVFMDLECVSEFELTNARLYLEIMGKYSNAVLVKDGLILGALKTTAIGENVKRVLFSGVKYKLPEAQDKIPPDDMQGLTRALENIGGDAAAVIAERVKGIAYSTALDIVETYGEKPTAEDVNRYICGGECSPCVTLQNGEPSDFKARSASADKIRYDGILKAQSAYYLYTENKRAFSEEVRTLLSAVNAAVKKQEKRLAEDLKKLDDCRDMDTVKLNGELITANIYAVERGMDCLEAVNYYDENCGKIKIALDKSLSPADNAQKYYKRYAKLKRTYASVSAQKAQTEAKLDYFKSIAAHINAAESLRDLEETREELKGLGLLKADAKPAKKPAVTPYREYEYGGFRIVAGRNNIQNERLTKELSPADLWLHTQKYHSSHVGVITGGKSVPDGVLKVAAEICAYYSDGRAGNKIPVDYALKKFVKKPPRTDTGFVIYTDYSTILVDPDPHADCLK